MQKIAFKILGDKTLDPPRLLHKYLVLQKDYKQNNGAKVSLSTLDWESELARGNATIDLSRGAQRFEDLPKKSRMRPLDHMCWWTKCE